MRPDSYLWRNTNDLTALEFVPRHLLYRRVPAWVGRTIMLQMILGVVIWCGLRIATTRSAPTPAPAATPSAAATPSIIVKPAHAVQTRLTAAHAPAASQGVARWVEAQSLRHIALAQLGAALITMLAAVLPIRSFLRRHVNGLQELFTGLRVLASGMPPKPLSAGSPGEVGYLALAFNDMTTRLISSHRRLLEMNQTLEQRVEERTRELREAAAKLEKMASTDAMTDLPNRRALIERGEQLFEVAKRADMDMACLMIDLDNFKNVNDTLGHKKGDELICLAAAALRDACRPDDVAARLGGDEFVTLIPDCDIDHAMQAAALLQSTFQTSVESLYRNTLLKTLPSMSIGIACRKIANSATFEELVVQADSALYRVKNTGKARAEAYAPRSAA